MYWNIGVLIKNRLKVKQLVLVKESNQHYSDIPKKNLFSLSSALYSIKETLSTPSTTERVTYSNKQNSKANYYFNSVPY